jgi:hypothetical protein
MATCLSPRTSGVIPEHWPKPNAASFGAQSRIELHPVFPDREGLAARHISGPDGVHDVIELLRLNYERASAESARR